MFPLYVSGENTKGKDEAETVTLKQKAMHTSVNKLTQCLQRLKLEKTGR